MLVQKRCVWILITAVALDCTGCSSLPVAGPTSAAIESRDSSVVPYHLVPVTANTVAVLEQNEPKGLAGVFTDGRPPANLVLGIGDVVGVTVFEAAAGGLYIPAEAGVRPGNFVQLPEQTIDNDGNITMPYGGIIRAAGHTTVQVQNAIISRIKNRAIDPQVVVSVTSQRTSLVSVMGEVNSPQRFAAAASGAGDRITDALTRAGGIRGQGYETWVVLDRGGRRATVPFENLIMNAANNIYIQPGDRIYVYREQQKFIAFGASGQQGEFPFDAWRINLAEAVAKAGGLVDTQADAASVFLYRQEPRDVAAMLGANVSGFTGPTVPVIFQISLADPSGYFLATKFMVRNQDVLFIANAKEVEISKFLSLLSLFTNTAANAGYAVTTGYAVRAAIRSN
ncbi:polysaccharide biosynthesis/export family protein [Lichenifustis flavocetrariae]|uniref:Polysaccharide export protein n=1 Tax=Lichenifustis flavocetrariae TaxID=2949735 RepID=A0AA41Z881_9HYPH|nr:polysaccharide biosynthesis/export family protein [Lichenifustis flavocetrariae]MCW6511082.1 polysaccharide export protein [Lichenifustis flavocetrariae]